MIRVQRIYGTNIYFYNPEPAREWPFCVPLEWEQQDKAPRFSQMFKKGGIYVCMIPFSLATLGSHTQQCPQCFCLHFSCTCPFIQSYLHQWLLCLHKTATLIRPPEKKRCAGQQICIKIRRLHTWKSV